METNILLRFAVAPFEALGLNTPWLDGLGLYFPSLLFELILNGWIANQNTVEKAEVRPSCGTSESP